MSTNDEIARLTQAVQEHTQVTEGFLNQASVHIENSMESFRKGTVLQESGGLYYEQYSTGEKNISLGDHPADTWITTPIQLTVSQTGTYLIQANIRTWNTRNTEYQWKKIRVLIGEEVGHTIFGFNKHYIDINLDSTNAFSFIAEAKAGDIIKVEVYFHNTAPKVLNISDANGSSSISAIKIGAAS